MEEKEKLIDALKTIRDYCRKDRTCADCPIFNKREGECHLMVDQPAEWKFREEIDQIIF